MQLDISGFFMAIDRNILFTLFEKLSGCKLPKGGVSTLRALKREVVEAFNILPEHSRFTAGMIAWLGFVSGSNFLPLVPLLASVAIVMLSLDSGMRTRVEEFRKHIPRTFLLALLCHYKLLAN